MLSIEEIRATGEMDPEFEPILKLGLPFLPGWDMNTDIHQVRAIIARAKAAQPKPDPESLPFTTEDVDVPTREGRKTTARIYKPRGLSVIEGRSGLVVFHGGGYTVGDLDTETWLCALFTSLGGVAVNVDYRHCPEHVFPAAIDDALDATKWVAQNAPCLGIDPSKGFLVGGESAGADLSLIVAHAFAEENISPPLTGVYAAIPYCINEETVPEKYKDQFFSLEQNASAPMLRAESIKFIHSIYKPDPKSSMAFSSAFKDHSKVPKTYFQACGLDPVRDCALVMEQILKDAGVETRLDIYPGLPHGFWAMFRDLKASKKHDEDSKKALEWLLS